MSHVDAADDDDDDDDDDEDLAVPNDVNITLILSLS